MEKIDEVAREIRREYFKQWRAANPDKVKKHNATYWRKLAEQKLKEQESASRNNPKSEN